MLNQAIYNNNKKRILFILFYIQFTNYNAELSEVEKWADFKQVFKNRFITFDEAEEAI